MTRCFIPPDNSCGYCLYLRSPSEIPTNFRISRAFCFFSAALIPFLPTKTSSICLPILMVGFRDVIGSWKMNPISVPRILRSAFLSILSTSSPLYKIWPPSKNPGGSGFSLMIQEEVTLFPQPDSPTIPRISPGRTSKLTSRTAFTTPP